MAAKRKQRSPGDDASREDSDGNSHPSEAVKTGSRAPARKPSQSTRDSPSGFAVVGIGASAGGLEALTQFFKAVQPSTGMAYVVIQHLDPTHESLTASLLSRHTSVPIVEATDEMAVLPDHVYVIPPNKYLTIDDNTLHVSDPVERRGLRVPIDFFFRALAGNRQEKAVGIILSGAGSDGAQGVREIKAAGGMVLVQEPHSATSDGMPRSAIATGVVDHILPIDEMPGVLARYVRHSYVNGGADPLGETGATPDHITTVLNLLRTRIKYDFGLYKKGTVTRRIQRRMGIHHVEQMDEYIDVLRMNADEVNALYKDLLISVTNFFREPESWQALLEQVIEPIVASHNFKTPIRAWVPGCATGEEAYSLAMLIVEATQRAEKQCPISIFASDIDHDALEFGRVGIYPENIAADVSPERLRRFFTKGENSYRISKELREMVVFAEQNVISDPPFSKLNLISCRNLLIYLEPEAQNRVFSLFHFALCQGGWLFLGGSETVSQQLDLFETVSRKWRIYRRIGPARHDKLELPTQSVSRAHGARSHVMSKIEPVLPPRFVALAQHLVLQRFAPACVLVNRKSEVLYLHGPIDDYLQLPLGELAPDVIAMARSGLRSKLRVALRKSIQDGQRVEFEGLLRRGKKTLHVHITVEPLNMPKEAEGLYLVSFGEVDGQRRAADTLPSAEMESQVMSDAEATIEQLESDLDAAREDLQSTIEELETSNEEFKASNEEIMSVNEELQSTNEELETSKEELQSLNEELQTVNAQLGQKITELELTNNDLANLLASTDIATIFLDRQFTLRRFTPAATRLLRVINTDIGRPITDFARNFTDDDLLTDAETVLQRLTPAEREVQDSQNRWYVRRIVPYRTEDDRINGVVITFTDITRNKQDAESLKALNDDLEQRVVQRTEEANLLVENALDGMVIIDTQGTILKVNRQTETMFGYDREALIGQPVDLLYPERFRRYHRQQRSGFFTDMLPRFAQPDIDLAGLRRDGSEFPIDVQWHSLELGGQPVAVAAIRDVTERQTANKTEAELAAIVNASTAAIIGVDNAGRIESWNKGTVSIFGYSADEAIGQNYSMLIPTERAGEFDRTVERLKQHEDVQDYESIRLHKDGTRLEVALTISLVKNMAGNVTGACAIVRDISEHKQLEHQIAEIADHERQRLGRELHDSLSQQITGMGMLAAALQRQLPADSPGTELAAKLESSLQDAKQEVRKVTKGVSPVDIDAEGIRAALENLTHEVRDTYHIACVFQMGAETPLEDNFAATQLYLVAREAVHNAVKHGNPRRITVSLEPQDGNSLHLAVCDDGVGMDVHAPTTGMGQHIMRYRCGLLGGRLTIDSPKTGGTCVTCTIPRSRSKESRRQ